MIRNRFHATLLFAVVTALMPSIAPAESASAFVWADRPESAGYSPNAGYARNPAGQEIRITRPAPGVYDVLFLGMGPQAGGGNTQVTAYGPGPEQCNVERWVPKGQDLSIRVRCYRGQAPVDTRFSLLFVPADSGSSPAVRFAWAGRPQVARYEAPRNYAANQGRNVIVERDGPGRYTIRFEGVDQATARGGNVQVTAYGNQPTQCKVIQWVWQPAGLAVQAACFDAQGQPADSPLSALFTPGG